MENQHISAQRKQRATQNIERKVQILQRYLSEGPPEGAFVPRNMTEFRDWEDTILGVVRIGSPNTLERGHNQPLKLKAKELIIEFVKRKRRKNKTFSREKLLAEARDRDRVITKLTNHWHSSRYECEKAQQNERRLKNRVAELLRDNGELTRKLNAIVPLQSA